MTRVWMPMMSLAASGTIGDSVTFSKWKGLYYTRLRVIPNNPRTAAQTSIRNTLKAGVSIWQDVASVPGASHTSWDYYASGTHMSGFNRYMSFFITTNTQQIAPWTVPDPT